MTELNKQEIVKDTKSLWVSASSALLTEEEQLTAMANDPEIQAEIAAMNKEFAVAEMDGL